MNISPIAFSNLSSFSSMGGVGMMQQAPPNAAELAASIIEQEDTDGDGMISAEKTKVSKDRFAELDADSDGLLTAAACYA